MLFPEVFGFDGETYNDDVDFARLARQLDRVFAAMRVHSGTPGKWQTLGEIAALTGDPEASISARLRDLRKPRCGALRVDRRHRGPAERGLYEYKLVQPPSE